MTKFRCFADVDTLEPGPLLLAADESHHVGAVLRVSVGDTLLVLNGRGQEALGRVTSIDKRAVELELSECRSLPDPGFAVTLFIGIPKLPAMETILQKATELGVRRICPILSAHSVVKLPQDKRSGREERWRKILLGAVKQCRNPYLPELLSVSDFEGAVERLIDVDMSIVGSLEDDAVVVRQIGQGAAPKRVGLWIGPEGDFSSEEYAQLRAAGVRAVSFGDRILRAETAVVTALSILNYEFE